MRNTNHNTDALKILAMENASANPATPKDGVNRSDPIILITMESKLTKTPVIVSLLSIVINIIGSLLLTPSFGVAGLALAFSIASIFNASVLWLVLRIQIGDLDDERILHNVSKISIGAMIAGWLAYGALYAVAHYVDTRTVSGLLIQALISAGVFCSAYVLYSIVLKVEEWKDIKVFIKKE